MRAKQKAKIKYNDGKADREVFFFQHNFKTAIEHAYDFIERHRGSFEMRVYMLNHSNYGEKWLHSYTVLK